MLSTKVVKVDFKKIIDNSLDKSFWTKRWTLFNYDNIVITMELSDIDITNQQVCLWVRGRHVEDGLRNSKFIYLPLNQYNETVFRNKLLGAAHDIVEGMEVDLARVTKRYEELKSEMNAEERRTIDELYEHLDSLGVEDDDVREVYVENKLYEYDFDEDLNAFLNSYKNNELYHVHNMIDVMIEFVERG